MPITVRPATADDQDRIVALVRRDRLKPTGLSWPNFVVAVDDTELVGAAQIRKHRDGSRELGSLIVVSRWRGTGVASRMVRSLLASEQGPVFTITGKVRAATFARWGFQPVDTSQAPAKIRFNYYVGAIGGGFVSLLCRCGGNRLIVLKRRPD